jgi:endonuclease G
LIIIVEEIKKNSWRKYLTSIDTIEKATGYNLLSNVPVDIQSVVEAIIDNND